MLDVFNISKSYTTAGLTQTALDDVSVRFRRNEFVAILGASGSGKTTLLNIIGGLDAYDSGDLQIDGISTTKFKDRDWDTYRNNRIGFVFQSYNLIPHQTVLANVELALTLSGVGKGERKARALDALAAVGLAEHVHKRPNQISGGQMQRVAIARALINDPEILLADEPTGALDSTTSSQIMALLQEIASDRLVVMVTHNPELAHDYATRTITLKDGQVVEDSHPYEGEGQVNKGGQTTRRTKMSSATALGLSFANLLTKRGRTLMTAFAGSIGIIGIAAILALASGVNDYIRSVEEDTLSVYPLTIQRQGMDMSAFLTGGADLAEQATTQHEDDDAVHEVQIFNHMLASVGANDLGSLKDFFDEGVIDEYVSSVHYSYDIDPHIYSPNNDDSYDLVRPSAQGSTRGRGPMSPHVFDELMENTDVVQTQYDMVTGRWPTDFNELLVVLTPSGDIPDFVLYAMGLRDRAKQEEMMQALAQGETPKVETEPMNFEAEEFLDVDFRLGYATDYYVFDEDFDVWVDKRKDPGFLNEIIGETPLSVVGVVEPAPGVSASALQPGIYYTSDLTRHVIDHANGTTIVENQQSTTDIDVFTGRPFSEGGSVFAREDFVMSELLSIDEDKIIDAFQIDENAFDIADLGISPPEITLPDLDLPDLSVDPEDLPDFDLGSALDGLEIDIDQGEASDVLGDFVTAYSEFVLADGGDLADVEENLPTFLASDEAQESISEIEELTDPVRSDIESRVQGAFGQYLNQSMGIVGEQISTEIAGAQSQIAQALSAQMGAAMGEVQAGINHMVEQIPEVISVDEEAFAEAFEFSVDEDELTELMLAMVLEEERSADANLRDLGFAEVDQPGHIDIYPSNFESKAEIISIIDEYNERMAQEGNDEKVVTYTDLVGTLMSSVTDILNVITYVLVAFVAISLVVSSIMIGVITYISVLERRKEIGILRAVGASKRDIRRVFNAETVIIGFLAGVMGIGVTFLLTLPANYLVNARFGIEKVAILPWGAAGILVAISMALTFLAGLIPASSAAREDPVEALRSD